MGYSFSISLSAEKDIGENYAWYDSKQIGLGEEFLQELEDHFNLIKESPNLFPKKHKGKFHQAALKRFPFVVIYEVVDENVVILSVFKTSQNPVSKP